MMIRKMLTLLSVGGAFALVVTGSACSSDEEEEKFASSDKFCVAKAEAECKNLFTACGVAEATCKTKRTSVCNTEAAAAANQGRSYRSSAAQPCIDKINEVFKTSLVTAAQDLEVVKVCQRTYGGNKKTAESCTNTYDCEGTLICDRGVCIKEDPTGLGAQCNNAGQVCQKGTYCQQRGENKFCVAKNEANDTCGTDNPCIETLRCVTTCIPKVAGGGACTSDPDCAEEAPFCDGITKKCVPKYQAATSACKEYGTL